MMDAKHLQRLKEEQEKALSAVDAQLEQWDKFRSDYVSLQEKLKTLPDKVTHDIRVPFGSLAFMPGQMRHTNEILVLLGDNYFVERSAKQAVEIVSRRLKGVDEKMAEIKKERELLVPRAEFTSEMMQMAQGQREESEIVEPYDEEQERVWRERHRQYLRKAGERRQRDRAAEEVKEEETAVMEEEEAVFKTDEELWERLDQLERQESRDQELEQISSEESELSNDSSSGEDVTDSDDEDDGERPQRPHRVIRFTHTKTSVTTENQPQSTPHDAHEEDAVSDVSGEKNMINSPADIYRMVHTGPRSILKSPSGGSLSDRRASLGDGQQKSVKFVTKEDTRRKERQSERSVVDVDAKQKASEKAFRDTVVERQTVVPATFPESSTTTPSASGDAPLQSTQANSNSSTQRPVSRFKASRQANQC